jgi:hypothetical protein
MWPSRTSPRARWQPTRSPPPPPPHFLPSRMPLFTLFNAFHLVCFVTPLPPYQVLTIQNETPVYKPPEVSAQDYAVIIGVCVTVFVRCCKRSTSQPVLSYIYLMYICPAGSRRCFRFSYAVLLSKEDQAPLVDQEAVRAAGSEVVVGLREIIFRLVITRENYALPTHHPAQFSKPKSAIRQP